LWLGPARRSWAASAKNAAIASSCNLVFRRANPISAEALFTAEGAGCGVVILAKQNIHDRQNWPPPVMEMGLNCVQP
jgi:hypothetical protein